MRGAVAVSASLADITITAGADALTLYQFNTMQAKHYFCSKCGIYTHHQRRSNPQQYGVNVACLEASALRLRGGARQRRPAPSKIAPQQALS
jgi:hypothetical protein